MMRHGSIEMDWADGTYTFRLGLKEIEELEEKCDLSIFLLADALGDHMRLAKLKHYMETIRIGLIGGGMKPVDALAKVRRYVDERPLNESRAVARAICLAALVRVHTDEPDLGEAVAPRSSGSTSAPSTELQQ